MLVSIIKDKKTVESKEFKGFSFKNKPAVNEVSKFILETKVAPPYYLHLKYKNLLIKRPVEEALAKEEVLETLMGAMEGLKDFREQLRAPVSARRTACSGAITYETFGGVFLKPDSITKLIGPDFKRRLLEVAKIPDSANKKNYVGIELELCIMVEMEQLKKLLIEKDLHRYVHCGSDGSVSPHKGGRAIEIRVLCLEQEVPTIITKLCEVLNSKTVGGYVNSSCGLHVHLDARTRNVEHMFKNLVMALPMLQAMVPQERVSGVSGRTHYCKTNSTGVFKTAAETGDRYYAINPMSYERHKTIEVRLHSGSTNANKIINWVNTLTTIVNHEKTLTTKIKTAEEFSEISNDEKLLKFINKRIATFKAATIDTALDETLDGLIETGSLAAIVNL